MNPKASEMDKMAHYYTIGFMLTLEKQDKLVIQTLV